MQKTFYSFLLIFITFLLLTSCEMKKYEPINGDDDSSSEVTDTDSASPDDWNDVENEPDSDETRDIDAEKTDEDHEDLPCGSVYFNGVDSYISVEHDDALNLGTTWTVEAWVMQSDLENQSPIIRKGDETESPSFWLYGKTPDLIDESFSNSPSGGFQYGASSPEYYSLHSLNDVKNGKWYHIALVKSETQLKLFINGIFQVAEDTEKNVFKNDQILYFGAKLNENKIYFYGLIDEIRFSNITRYTEKFVPETKLSADSDTIASWHFEETTGIETQSDGKNILTGILNGSAIFVNECAANDNNCENECFFAGEEACSDGILKKCTVNDKGCYVSEQEECATGLCANTTSCAVDNCPFAGSSQCTSGEVVTCRELGNGLLDWSLPVTCSDGVCADESSCLSCSNECEYLGQTKCSDGKISVCINDGCLKWDTAKNCALNECKNSTVCKSDGWIDVAAGRYKCGINSGGELFCWKDEPYPEKMSPRTDWSKVSVLSFEGPLSYFCAIASGELHCMGYNKNGELGDGTDISKNTFVRIGSRNDWTDIYTHPSVSNISFVKTTCGIAGGELFCWGDGILSPKKMDDRNDWQKVVGNCGIASGKLLCWNSLFSEPEQVGTREDWENIIPSDLGYYCGIASGELYCWGNNNSGQLGDGTFESKSDPVKIGERNDWSSIAGGDNFTCGIAGGELLCWGSNNTGMFGDSTIESVNVPTKISTLNSWSNLSSGMINICASESDNIYCWEFYRDSIFKTHNVLLKVRNLSKWAQISTGRQNSCGIAEGKLYCNGIYYDMVYSDFSQITDHSDWDSVSTGDSHNCAIRNEDLYCWGKNNSGQVGDSTTEFREDPVQIGLDRKWEAVSCGGSHNCGTSGGELYCWGSNNESNFPQRIGSKIEWEKISAGDKHTCGIESGELYCWGENLFGQLGTGNTDSSDEPVRIGNKSDWEQVSAGNFSTCAIAAGEFFCWGQITTGLTGKLNYTPVKIGNYSDFKQIALTENIVCGLRSDDHLYCWSNTSIISGYNDIYIYPEKIADIKWDYIFGKSSNNICGITQEQELYCIFPLASSFFPKTVINP